jgi:hypothetical protein
MISSTDPWVWAKDEEGHRHLCPINSLSDPNCVNSQELNNCVDDDSRLETREYVPSNDPQGKINFAQSASPN